MKVASVNMMGPNNDAERRSQSMIDGVISQMPDAVKNAMTDNGYGLIFPPSIMLFTTEEFEAAARHFNEEAETVETGDQEFPREERFFVRGVKVKHLLHA